MSVDFQQVHAKIHEIGSTARADREALDRKRRRARELLEGHANNLEALREKVERLARDLDPALRCASPCQETLLTHHPAGPVPSGVTLVAIDGSQIVPDRHRALVYGLINIGAVSLQTGSAAAPQVFTESRLLFEGELRDPASGSLMDESAIALKRDAMERSRLLALAREAQEPVVALTDGPVELWGAKDPANAGAYQQFLRQYLEDLDRFNELGTTLGGYVDKPAADLVVRLLEIAGAAAEDQKDLRKYHPLLGVTDRWLFGRLLGPGERSAVFALQSSSRARYSERRAIHFFYLNPGSTGHPSIARVEFPQWVADDPAKLERLHAALLQQNSLLGARPYPYLLHRAHEAARVSFDEKEQVELLLSLELRRQGLEVEEGSAKQAIKDHSAEKRSYGR